LGILSPDVELVIRSPDVINASAGIRITKEAIVVKFQRRAPHQLVLAAGFANTEVAIPWLRGKRLRLAFG
jgi:hypothetical protein